MGEKASVLLQTFNTMPPLLELSKKLKRLAFLGSFLVTVCALCGLFYLDNEALINGFGAQTKSGDGFPSPEKNGSDEFLSEKGKFCNVFDGDWVWDETYPLYQSRDCRFLDGGFRCSENGRPDLSYTKWRWQPKHCNLPRFDAKVMLGNLRNKRLVFIGDSIGRNQWESLLCMLSTAVPDKDSVYEVNGNPITKHRGFLAVMFRDYNCTVEYYRAPFLVPQGRPPQKSPPEVRITLKIDQMDWSSSKWKDADVLVLNTGRWWSYDKTIRGGCYFQEGEEVKMEMGVDIAYKKSLETVMRWMQGEVNPTKTRVFFRSYAPVHFSGGDWRNGGGCHLNTQPEKSASFIPPQASLFFDAFAEHSNTSMPEMIEVLNVTSMASLRQDGHLSIYYLGPEGGLASLSKQDCSHWCLPGVPDSWNELLHALLLKREFSGTVNSAAAMRRVLLSESKS